MNWLQMDRYYLESDCGKYTIAKCYSGGTADYTLWRLRKGCPGEPIKTFATAEEAKAHAETLA